MSTDRLEFQQSILDTIDDHIVVIDRDGDILYSNRSWEDFGQANGCAAHDGWLGVNYLEVCAAAADSGDEFGARAAAGILDVIAQRQKEYLLEYPCHGPDEWRWFAMRAAPFSLDDDFFLVISHHNITERKKAEEAVLSLARVDGLTQIANRRYFDEFLRDEWQRCQRLQMPLSLALIDLDHFKQLNDSYGHPAGDRCLARVGELLDGFAQRPGDLCARYGGEEFALVFGNTAAHSARDIIFAVLEAVRGLGIANEKSTCGPTLTASIGLGTCTPGGEISLEGFVAAVDTALYAAKADGRDRLVARDCDAQADLPARTAAARK